MNTLILLINIDQNGDPLSPMALMDHLDEVTKSIRELQAWQHDRRTLLLYYLDYQKFPTINDELSSLWPTRLNLFGGEYDQSESMAALGHFAIQLHADVYQLGADRATETIFHHMGIEVSKLPIE